MGEFYKTVKTAAKIGLLVAAINAPDVCEKLRVGERLSCFLNQVPLTDKWEDFKHYIYSHVSSDLFEKKSMYSEFVKEAAQKYLGGNEKIIWSVMLAESEFDATCVSRKGAVGLMQIMPNEANKGLNLFDPKINIELGAKELANYKWKFGSWRLALAAYNSGPNRESIRNGKIPKITETMYYVPKVFAYLYLFDNMIWPVSGSRQIDSTYGVRMHPILHVKRYHYGVDIDSELGEPVYAGLDGKVIEAEASSGNGNMIKIEKKVKVDGGENISIKLMYSHLSTIMVKVGQEIKRGQNIGRVGSTGLSTGPHLDLKVLVGNKYIDPILFLDGKENLFATPEGAIVKREVESREVKIASSEKDGKKQQ